MNKVLLIFLAGFIYAVSAMSVRAAEGSLYMLPERGSYSIGETFVVSVLADSGGEPISAAEAELTFNSDGLEVLDISTKDSIMESWPTEPTYSNTAGTIRFAGWAKEQYSGNAGLLVSITFRALRNSASNMQLAAGAILAADGVGTNIITSMKSGLYTVEPKKTVVDDAVPISENSDTAEVQGDGELQSPGSAPIVPTSFPRFVSFEQEVAVGQKIVIQGVAIPNAEVSVHFGRESEKFNEVSVVSAADGTFTFVSEEILREGQYQIKAAVVGEGGVSGPFSETIVVRAVSLGVAASFVSLAGVAWTVVPLIALLALIGIGIAYVMYIHRRHVSAR